MSYPTQVLKAGENFAGCPGIRRAAESLRAGELVAIPTETVYGLAANALDEQAVGRIFAVKGRPADNPLIVHISEMAELEKLTMRVPESALRLAKRYWPGPLTMVLPSREDVVPSLTRAGLSTVAVRMPAHPVARALIAAAGLPLAAPSANLSGKPSPTTAAHCFADLNGLIPFILDGGPCGVGVESTVVDMTGETPRLLRPGAVTPEMIKDELGELILDPAIYSEPDPQSPVASPGMRHKHYAPKAKVAILKGDWQSCKAFMALKKTQGAMALVFEEELSGCPLPALSLGPQAEPETHARALFACLRELDERGAERVYARCPQSDGMGLAVYNRLIRAAGFEEITVDS
ncbi:MAG: L-threonylcarbamoyladenylate synthase [Oscillospiraceae bacterium]|nr:L-threonylcarbamoyladenylate synthase [Oscillospiraceae bacterium]